MDKKLKTKWLAALRGGKYEQGRGQLYRKSDGTFCCIGVLCAVARKGVKARPQDNALYEWAAEKIGANTVNTLWKMNDGVDGRQRHTFQKIAAYISKNL
jgi:hypothetical protein